MIRYRPFPQEIDETLKIPEKCWLFNVSEFYQSIAVQFYQLTLIRWLSLLYAYKWTTVSVTREPLSISMRC